MHARIKIRKAHKADGGNKRKCGPDNDQHASSVVLKDVDHVKSPARSFACPAGGSEDFRRPAQNESREGNGGQEADETQCNRNIEIKSSSRS